MRETERMRDKDIRQERCRVLVSWLLIVRQSEWQGHNYLFGCTSGMDLIRCTPGTDLVRCTSGTDLVRCTSGTDLLRCTPGTDLLR